VSLLLDVRGLRAGYGRTEVLHGAELRVPTGTAVAVLGANGAGKTTLLNTIAGLLRTWDGHIAFRGQPIHHRAAHSRTRSGVCLIPEGRGIFRGLTVRENLRLQAGEKEFAEALDRVAAAFPVLTERLHQQAGTLSGGQQQMLSVARALITDAPLVLADELSVGLAPVVVDEIFAAVELLKQQGRSLVLVEQYVERAVAVADYVYILHKGMTVFVGEPGQCRSGEVFERYLGGAA
jgi:branched-chain amino acid transport system ATP-binding protein